ncbi:MAG: hypothetical protein KGJ60_04230, partial [Verrucomicrobiota bacterium]|nr:hypothetical protein [Verrucomicrobiota bacterium]
GPQYYCDGCLTLGYQYPRIDYLFSQTTVNGNLTFQPGTVVAWQGQGLSFSGAYTLTFDGTVQNRCYFLPCNTVQEQSSGGGPGITGNGVSPTINATFTRFWALDQAAFFDANALNVEDAYNCEFWQGTLGGTGFVIGGLDLYLVNCLLDDSSVNFNTTSTSSSCDLSMQNCTMIAGGLYISRNNPNQLWQTIVTDSAFDETAITVNDPYGSGTYPNFFDNYNAYSGGFFLPNDSHDVSVTAGFDWQVGPLGNFYLPDNPGAQDGTLCLNAGYERAIYIFTEDGLGNTVKLGEFTTDPKNQTPEDVKSADLNVDIGYHYAAKDTISIGRLSDATEPGCSTCNNGILGYFNLTNNGLYPATAYYSAGGTAQPNADYVTLSGAIPLGPDQTAEVTVTPIYGPLDPDEFLTLTLTANNAYAIDPNNASAAISIKDYANPPYTTVITLNANQLDAVDSMDYSPTANALIASVSGGDPDYGNDDFVELGVNSSGQLTKNDWTSITGLQDEIELATVKTTTSDFPQGPGLMFFGNYDPSDNPNNSYVGEVSPDGASYETEFAELAGDDSPVRGGLYVDQTGIFGNDLVVVTENGGVWQIDSSGSATSLANINNNQNVFLEGVITLPSDSAWGPWAGKIITGDEDTGVIYAIDMNKTVNSYNILGNAPYQIHPEDFTVIPDESQGNQDLYVCSGNTVYKIEGSYFIGHAGDLLISDEAGQEPGLYIVRWDTTASQFLLWFIPSPGGGVEHATFAPLSLPSN